MIYLSITPVEHSIQVGDRITAPPLPDHRSWWQCNVPKWLGGKNAPQPLDSVIAATTTGGR